ncbi:response regulator transcription factor [Nocardioides zhouii]|uniref:Response regulator transcription factor n=2 Tax=Nocardioides zhouii TaxID=1168729 RepID=A0A4Q2T7F7_9ACTN|nr:response regulator transcription factor [Nocardioides zhouii]
MVAAYSSTALARAGTHVVSALVIVVGIALLGRESGDEAFMAIVFGAAWLMGFVVAQRSGQLVRLTGDNRDLADRLASATAVLAEAEDRRRRGGVAPAPADLAVLTGRELEVARAVASGMSNAEIAQHLVISEWTVKTHVASILRKLRLRDRTQVVVAAYESGLVRPAAPPEGATADD